LALSAGAGLAIGLNRGEHGHPAGLRTTLLVALAATAVMIQVNLLLPMAGKAPDSFITNDLVRLPLGILSGIGFIGAGAILRRGDAGRGITTAATLWMMTIIGLCFGGGRSGMLDLARQQDASGISDFLRVLDAQRQVLAAEQQEADSHAAVSIDPVSLYKALGGGWIRRRRDTGDRLRLQRSDAPCRGQMTKRARQGCFGTTGPFGLGCGLMTGMWSPATGAGFAMLGSMPGGGLMIGVSLSPGRVPGLGGAA
jgi:MgtC family